MGIWSFTCSETSWPRSSSGAELAPNTTNSIRIILIKKYSCKDYGTNLPRHLLLITNYGARNADSDSGAYADALHMIERPDLAEVYRGAYSLIRDFAQ